MNTLYYGDNLKILRDIIENQSIDLVYLDPPFNSNRNYNVLFKDESGVEADSQITAFEDTWHWNASAEETYRELLLGGDEVSTMIESFRGFIGENQMMAYLVMMAVRLKELHRVLKSTGSLYLHCDPTASHYLKILLDTIFGAENYRNEVTWQRTFAHGNVGRNYGNIADLVFFYTKGNKYTWNQLYTQPSHEELKKKYPNADSDGRRRQSVSLRNPAWRPNLQFQFTASNGITYTPHPNGWAGNLQHLQKLDAAGKLHFPSRPEGALRLKMYEDESRGERLQNIWDDIPPIGAQAAERMGYPTQKARCSPRAHYQLSSNEGDVVLDPFCGCGTTIAAAQKLGRRWLGIDITHLSIALQKYRLKDSFNLVEKKDYAVIGEPEDLESAKQLASEDRYQFQWWALSLIKARPLGGSAGSKEGKKGSDKGIDGLIPFIDDNSGKAKRAIVSVKSGHVKSGDIRDLKGVLERENAAMGIFVTLESPSKDMNTEAVTSGFYTSEFFRRDFPKIQILTVEELLAGKTVAIPTDSVAFKEAEGEVFTHKDQYSLGFDKE